MLARVPLPTAIANASIITTAITLTIASKLSKATYMFTCRWPVLQVEIVTVPLPCRDLRVPVRSWPH